MRTFSFLEATRRHLPLILVLVTGTALSLLVFQMKREAVSERQRAIFAELAHGYARGFQWELDAHLAAVRSLRDFILASPEMDRAAFSSFARASLPRAPALEALQWLPLVRPEEREAFETEAAVEGAEDFFLFKLDERREKARAEPAPLHFPVRYAEAQRKGGEILGFDYASDAVLRATLATVSESGGLVVSEPVHLLRNRAGEAGVLLAAPVFAGTDGEKRVRGLVAAPLDIAALCHQALEDPEASLIQIQLIDTSGEAPKLLFSNRKDDVAKVASSLDTSFTVGGREWHLVLFAESSALTPGAVMESWSLLAGGLVFTGFTALWIRQRQSHLHSIEKKVNERTAALSRINQDLQNEMMQRRKAQMELSQSEARFREAFLHAPVGIGLLSPKGEWIQVNQALVEMTGFSEAELYEKTLAEMLHPSEVQHELATMAQMLAGEITTLAREQLFRHKEGHYLSVLMNVSQVRDENDQLLYFVCQILDISERNQALEETRRAKEFLENIIKSSNDGIFAFDLTGKFTVWNDGMEEMTGVPASEALGRSSRDVLPFLMETGDERAFQRVLAGGTVRAAERPFSVPSSGRSGYFAGHYAPLHDGRDGILGGVAVVRDVTEQRKARERLQAFAELLKQRNRELQDFAYVASHDLQEPLRKIRAFGDRLTAKCSGALDEQAQDYLKRMQDAAGRMQTLINDLLSFSRISTEAHPFAPVDLNLVVREVLSDLESRIEETGAEVEVGRLPTVEADPTQIRQLLQNLIGNALKYHRKEVRPHVQVFATTHAAEADLPPLEGAGCLLHVEDNGIGFEEKYLDRIFTVFQRLHGRTEYQGTGVGLAICRKIAERHNGWITARSVPGEGSTFITALPYKQNQKT